MFTKLRRIFNFKNVVHLSGTPKEETEKDRFKEKCAELEQSLKLTGERINCIMNILRASTNPKLYEFHRTDKGIPVLVSIDQKRGRVEVFNINSNPEGRCLLRLDAHYTNNNAEITHISGGIGLGHGKTAVERFAHHCIENGVERINVRYAPHDRTHETRFIHFFTKCGFQVVESERNEMVMQYIRNITTVNPRLS